MGTCIEKTVLVLIFAGSLLLPDFLLAQGTLYISNVGQAPSASTAIGSDSWVAQAFNPGTNAGGYLLNSVELLMKAPSGSPSGFSVSIYSSVSGAPGSSLGSLTGAAPAAGGLFAYSTPGITLLPSSRYFVVLTSATAVADGAYFWSATDASAASNGWSIGPLYFASTDGLTWPEFSRVNTFQVGFYATEVPEPRACALAGLAWAILGFGRWRHGLIG
jgi:hypothetical protein